MPRVMPELETERLRIRPFTRGDLGACHRILDGGDERGMSLEQRREWLEWCVLNTRFLAELYQPPYGERAVTLRDGSLVGVVGVVPFVDSLRGGPGGVASADVALYWFIAAELRGRGRAAEAARAVVRHLFDEERLDHVIATTEPDNLASQAVMRKLGMTVERAPNPHAPEPRVIGTLTRDAFR
jgi:RimJ/RimL family protein N-acetyltransferase